MENGLGMPGGSLQNTTACGTKYWVMFTCIVQGYYNFYTGQKSKILESPVKYRTSGNTKLDWWKYHSISGSWIDEKISVSPGWIDKKNNSVILVTCAK